MLASEQSLSSGMTISVKLDVLEKKEKATIALSGSRDDIIQVAQQLAWLGATFRIPIEGKLARSEFTIHSTEDPSTFHLKLLPLKEVRTSMSPCWHPLFAGGVLAYCFPIRSRNGETGIELPFDAMGQLAGILGPVEYKGGLVLKGYSTMIFPTAVPSSSDILDQRSTQWHLLYQEDNSLARLTLMAEQEAWIKCPLEQLESLVHARTFLGSYKRVEIHLGTENAAYDRITFSDTKDRGRKFEVSGFTIGLSLPKFGGPAAAVNFVLPKSLSLPRREDSYEQILLTSSIMPIILYDTSDRRAWMVPALGVILHMIHVWAFLQKKNFPALCLPDLPYIKPQWDVGRAAQEVIYQNSNLELYVSKDDDKPYLLKDLVKRYWLELETVIAIGAEQNISSVENLTGWELMEIIGRNPRSALKEPSTRSFEGNWKDLASDPNMVVLFCQGVGDIIVPSPDSQNICSKWKLVPPGKDYLTASVNCIMECSKRFPGSGNCSQLARNVFWRCRDEDILFADCIHDDHFPCQRVQQLVSKCNASQSLIGLQPQGAVVFGHRKLQRRIA